MKRLLVTTDFSDLGDSAIGHAADLAKRIGASLTLIHVLGGERPPKPDEDAAYFEVAKRLYDADAEMEQTAQASLEERAKGFEGLEWKAAIARGSPIEGILSVAKAEQIDLIVISSQGRTGLTRIFLGSVAEELARESPVPVLIWKEPRPA